MADETPYWADEATTRARVDAGDLTVGIEEAAALLAEVDRLRAREAAMLTIVAMLSACEAAQSSTFTVGGIDGVLLYHTTTNVLWMREQARALLASLSPGTATTAAEDSARIGVQWRE